MRRAWQHEILMKQLKELVAHKLGALTRHTPLLELGRLCHFLLSRWQLRNLWGGLLCVGGGSKLRL